MDQTYFVAILIFEHMIIHKPIYFMAIISDEVLEITKNV